MKLYIRNEKNQSEEIDVPSDPQAYGYAAVAFFLVAIVAITPLLLFWN